MLCIDYSLVCIITLWNNSFWHNKLYALPLVQDTQYTIKTHCMWMAASTTSKILNPFCWVFVQHCKTHHYMETHFILGGGGIWVAKSNYHFYLCQLMNVSIGSTPIFLTALKELELSFVCHLPEDAHTACYGKMIWSTVVISSHMNVSIPLITPMTIDI